MTNDRYLFRGFHKCENGKETIYIDDFPIKGKWLFGYLVKEKKYYITNDTTMFYEVIPETIGQWSGLEDKNDKKIFENDVVKARYKNNNGYIKWNSNNASFQIKGITSHTLKRAEDLEIIGTIFDKEVNDNE